MKRCPDQGKKKFHTKADALIYTARRRFAYGRHRAYECPHCGFWHLATRKAFRRNSGTFEQVRNTTGRAA